MRHDLCRLRWRVRMRMNLSIQDNSNPPQTAAITARILLCGYPGEEEDKKELLQQEETKDEKEKMATRHREQRVMRKGERFKGAYKCLGG